MSTLKWYTKSADGTIPVPALLYDDEEILASQEGVGIYDGHQKSPQHQSGVIHATSHRLFYVDNIHPASRSFALDLAHISKTDYYAGLLRSSAKITLYLTASSQNQGASSSSNPRTKNVRNENSMTWECEVCSYRNPSGLTSAATEVCGLCGVPRSCVKGDVMSSSLQKQLQTISLSSSLPSSSVDLRTLISTTPVSRSDSSTPNEVACPACTFLNHPSLPTCEICGTALPKVPPRHIAAKSAPSSRPPSDDEDEDDTYGIGDGTPRMVKLSFRRGGDKPFYTILRRALLAKAWVAPKATSISSHKDDSSTTRGRSGINSILHEVSTHATASQSNLEDALQDLEALMIKAREMVRYAEDLNEKLTAATTATTSAIPNGASSSNVVEPEEATFIRSSLAQLGLQMENAPVTQDMIKDERKWYEELARELAGVLQGRQRKGNNDDSGIMRTRGVVGLDEVWGGWNRARGVALIPPSTFLLVLPYLPVHTSPPVRVRTFSSGLSVLHTPPFNRAAFSSRLIGHLTLAGPRTTVEIAYEERLPIGLTQDMILEVEEDGDICRDDGGTGVNVLGGNQGGETQWWTNIFRNYSWDGQSE